MTTTPGYESLLNEAKTMYASGHDNTYIEFQFADRGIDDATIDALIKDISALRKSGKRRRGVRLFIYGLSFIAVGIFLSYASNTPESPARYVLWGVAVSGVLMMARGIVYMTGI